MMLNFYLQSIIAHEFALKLNLKSSRSVCSFGKLTANISEKRAKNNAALIFPLIYTSMILTEHRPKLTTVKKPVAAFKTRLGDVIAIKLSFSDRGMLAFLQYFFTLGAVEFSSIGLFVNLNINNTGVLQFSVSELRTLSIFKDTYLTRMAYAFGSDFNLSVASLSKQKNLPRGHPALFISLLSYFSPIDEV